MVKSLFRTTKNLDLETYYGVLHNYIISIAFHLCAVHKDTYFALVELWMKIRGCLLIPEVCEK